MTTASTLLACAGQVQHDTWERDEEGAPIIRPRRSDSVVDSASLGAEAEDARRLPEEGRASSELERPGFQPGPDLSDLEAWASRIRTPNRCEVLAQETVRSDPEEGYLRLRACSRRPDFDLLEPLLRAPWRALLRSRGIEGLEILARAMSKRRDFEADLASVRLAGFELFSLEEDGKAEALRGRHVFTVGVVNRTGRGLELSELGRFKAKHARYFSYGRLRRYSYDQLGRLSALSVADGADTSAADIVTTGRLLRVSSTPRCRARLGEVRALLGRVVGVIPASESEIGEVVRLRAIRCYPVGMPEVE